MDMDRPGLPRWEGVSKCVGHGVAAGASVLREDVTATVETSTRLTGIFIGERCTGELEFRDRNSESVTDKDPYFSAPELEGGEGRIVPSNGAFTA